MDGFHCEECNQVIDPYDYCILAEDERYRFGDAYIVHAKCILPDDAVLHQQGDLVLVQTMNESQESS